MRSKIYRKWMWHMPVIEYSPWAVLGVLVWKAPEIIRALCDGYAIIVDANARKKQANEKTPSKNLDDV